MLSVNSTTYAGWVAAAAIIIIIIIIIIINRVNKFTINKIDTIYLCK